MAKVVDLNTYRMESAEVRGFSPWKKRFGEIYDRRTTLADLSDATLRFLATPGEESAAAFYELVMGVLDLGPGTKFSYLDQKTQMRVVDVHLFLSDQMRFEMMRRLGWVDAFVSSGQPLMALVMDCEKMKSKSRETPPQLSSDHPGYVEYKQLTIRDRESFIRRLLPEALERFPRK